MLILDALWWAGLAWCAAWAALPLVAVPVAGPVAGFVIWAVLAPWTALAGTALAQRLLPRSEPGTYRLPGDPGATRWALSGWAPSVYLTLFQPLFFNSRGFQRLVLAALGARLGPGAWVTSRTVIREPHHVRIGAGSLVGEYAHLVSSYQPRPGLLLVGDITIGDDTLIGAYTHVGPGAAIGSGCTVGHGVALGGWTTVGDGVRIGAGTTVYNRVRIGADAEIGKNCFIPTGAVIERGARVPDGTVLSTDRGPLASEVAP
jgi:carbonic anhydrase/acetyltransferase-like protein (isoleucine patch superfamily)